MSAAPDQHCILQLGMSRRELFETFLAYSPIETIERKLRGFVFRVAKFSAYSRKTRTATNYRHFGTGTKRRYLPALRMSAEEG
jgi:hypothetical protein